MKSFRSLVAVAALAGLAGGLALTAIQPVTVSPLIAAAEDIERAAHPPEAAGTHALHDQEARVVQLVLTAGTNVVLATGFALLLAAAMSLRGDTGWKRGLLYGLAGYAGVFVAPSLGLPPGLPGTEAASLAARQFWWAGTASMSCTGLALIALVQQRQIKAIGAVLIVLPNVIGAPQPTMAPTAASGATAFIAATALANAVLWSVVGAVTGWLSRSGSVR